MLTTTLTDALAFGISSTTVLPALGSFCLWALFGVLAAFMATCSLFAALLVWDTKRQADSRFDCCCWKMRPLQEEEEEAEQGWCCCSGGRYTARRDSRRPLRLRDSQIGNPFLSAEEQRSGDNQEEEQGEMDFLARSSVDRGFAARCLGTW